MKLLFIRFPENAARHVVVLDARTLDRDRFFADLESRVGRSRNSEAFLFVHGFNVGFGDALRRTAQISFDLGFDGAPVLYSWPSQGSPSPLSYTADSQVVEWSKEILKDFIRDFLGKTSARNIYLIAHSMGNRPLTAAFISLFNEHPEFRQRIKEVVLAAPDIDAEIFKRDIAPALARLGRPVTLYASSADKALILSKIPNNIPRAGDAGPGLVVVDGVETIDASNVDTSFLGHSYFADTRQVMSDLQVLFSQGLRPAQRSGLRQPFSSRPYWEFRK
jgi:esterase/lipase superfamily enzyme